MMEGNREWSLPDRSDMSEREMMGGEGRVGGERVAGISVVESSEAPPGPLLSTRGGRPPQGSDTTAGPRGVFPAESPRGAFLERGRKLLDSAYGRILAGDVAIGMD